MRQIAYIWWRNAERGFNGNRWNKLEVNSNLSGGWQALSAQQDPAERIDGHFPRLARGSSGRGARADLQNTSILLRHSPWGHGGSSLNQEESLKERTESN